jgi:hypothetical protein
MVDILDEGAIPSSSTINTFIECAYDGAELGSTGVEKIVRD